MSTQQNIGIDYGLGTTNIDLETGIRYGVISQNEVLQAWADDAEADYGDPTCGHCGNPASDSNDEKDSEIEDAVLRGGGAPCRASSVVLSI